MNVITYFFTTYVENKEKDTINYKRNCKYYVSTFRQKRNKFV